MKLDKDQGLKIRQKGWVVIRQPYSERRFGERWLKASNEPEMWKQEANDIRFAIYTNIYICCISFF